MKSKLEAIDKALTDSISKYEEVILEKIKLEEDKTETESMIKIIETNKGIEITSEKDEEGKPKYTNETQRKYAKEEALRKSEEYKSAIDRLHTLIEQIKRKELEAEIQKLKHKSALKKVEIVALLLSIRGEKDE